MKTSYIRKISNKKKRLNPVCFRHLKYQGIRVPAEYSDNIYHYYCAECALKVKQLEKEFSRRAEVYNANR